MTNLEFSEKRLHDFLKIIDQINEKLLQSPAQIDSGLLLEDNDVMELLHISRGTLFNYRKSKKITYVKLSGRNYYFKHLLMGDLLKLYKEQNGG